MVKRVCALMIAGSFLIAAFPLMASAAQPFARQQLITKSVAGLKQTIATADDGQSGALSAITLQFLDDLAAAGLKNDRAAIELVVLRYVADVQEMKAAAEDASSCDISFWISTSVATVGMITELTSGNSAVCMVINLTNKVADIMSASTKKDICVIDASETPDEAKRAALVTQLFGIATYNFTTSAMNVFLCTPAPGVSDYISLVFDLIAIFTPPAPPAAS